MHCPELGDYIGVESCVDMKPDVADTPSRTGGRSRCRRQMRDAAAEKEYPPPIPFVPPPHMPWVMKKYYTSDGRLVIKEEKVKRHEYFQAHRSNGRLVLNLVPLDESCNDHRADEGDDKLENVAMHGEEIIGGSVDPTVEEVLPECYLYNGVGVNPCGGFEVAAAAAFRPPVHT